MSCCPYRWWQAAQRCHVYVELVNKPSCQGQRVLLGLCRALDDLVVNVGEVAHVLHLVLQRPQQAVQHVKGDIHTSVTCRRRGREDRGWEDRDGCGCGWVRGLTVGVRVRPAKRRCRGLETLGWKIWCCVVCSSTKLHKCSCRAGPPPTDCIY